MRHRPIVLVLGLLALLVAASGPAVCDEQAAWSQLRSGGSVALVRHGDAPGGAGDPAGFNLEDCSTQRNLSEKGKAQAETVGKRFKAERIAVVKVLSSPWCRCLDTARLMDLGTVEVEQAFSNVFVLREQRAALTDGARRIIAGWKSPQTLVVVTHGANIEALLGYNPAQGETVVVRGRPDGTLSEVGRISAPE
jgi:broad specificity phosphatase PhoE